MRRTVFALSVFAVMAVSAAVPSYEDNLRAGMKTPETSKLFVRYNRADRDVDKEKVSDDVSSDMPMPAGIGMRMRKG